VVRAVRVGDMNTIFFSGISVVSSLTCGVRTN
jgi:hypothetical protein